MLTRRTRRRSRVLAAASVAACLSLALALPGVPAAARPPSASLAAAPALRLTGDVDSNSPSIWDLVNGRPVLHVVTSTAGVPSLATGRMLTRLGGAVPMDWTSHPGHGAWMEAVVADESGTWYGYYHNEMPADLCERPERALPRIGAARSRDRGLTWADLGIILEAPEGWHTCETRDGYFIGGVGDFSAMLDRDRNDLYLFFSQYSGPREAQGVAVARMPWADRDEPRGHISVWTDGIWQPVTVHHGESAAPLKIAYPSGTSLVPVQRPWHDDDPVNDAFWGPSVHWNTYLEQYVMLLNRTTDDEWRQAGIYVSFAETLDDPGAWSPPQELLEGGGWYPQVIGLETGLGTDKSAGRRARFFMSGASEYYIDFRRTDGR